MKLIFIYFLLINLLSFILMYVDKKRAILHKWRISEKSFFILCILGGSLGEILGIYTFRHKTKHLKFTLGFPLILIIQLLIFQTADKVLAVFNFIQICNIIKNILIYYIEVL